MAKAPDSLEEILSCQVCFEEFTEDGDHVPRILPCSHTLCHTCTSQLIHGTRIECPECRKEHEAKNEEKSFPHNKYILVQMKRRAPKLQKDHSQPEKCIEHGKELNIFCKEPGCQKIICLGCLSRGHNKHEVIDVEERKKELTDILQKNIKAVTDNLERKIRKLTIAKQEVANEREKNIKVLKMKKEAMMKRFDKMIEESEDQMKRIEMNTNQDVDAMEETLNLLQDLKSTNATEGDTYPDVVNNLEVVRGIIENVNKHLTGTRTYEYHEYALNIETKVTKKHVVAEINEEIVDENMKTKEMKPSAKEQPGAAQLRGKMTIRNVNKATFPKINEHL